MKEEEREMRRMEREENAWPDRVHEVRVLSSANGANGRVRRIAEAHSDERRRYAGATRIGKAINRDGSESYRCTQWTDHLIDVYID